MNKPEIKVKLSKLRDLGWTLWDPIGLLPSAKSWDDVDNSSFAGEYDSYLISAASQLVGGALPEDVIEYLVQIETEYMGLGEDPSTKLRATSLVGAMLADEAILAWPDEQGMLD